MPATRACADLLLSAARLHLCAAASRMLSAARGSRLQTHGRRPLLRPGASASASRQSQPAPICTRSLTRASRDRLRRFARLMDTEGPSTGGGEFLEDRKTSKRRMRSESKMLEHEERRLRAERKRRDGLLMLVVSVAALPFTDLLSFRTLCVLCALPLALACFWLLNEMRTTKMNEGFLIVSFIFGAWWCATLFAVWVYSWLSVRILVATGLLPATTQLVVWVMVVVRCIVTLPFVLVPISIFLRITHH